MSSAPFRNPLVLALDLDSIPEIENWVERVGHLVGGIKLGPRAFLKMAPTAILALARQAPLFLDGKFFDIPSSTDEAVRSAFDLGAAAVTIHATAGQTTLSRLAATERELNQTRPFRILVVSVLTSWGSQELPRAVWPLEPSQAVLQLIRTSYECGLRSFVLGGTELALVSRTEFPELFLVCPGIRRVNLGDDQTRTMNPEQAVKAGANALVVGRPIIKADNPETEIQSYLSAVAL